MHDFDWNDLKHFLTVARAGTVSQAGRELGVNYTTVSRRVTALERSLGVSLFDRTGNEWMLTGAGEQILANAEKISDFAGEVKRNAIKDSAELSGLLRVTAVGMIFQRILMPHLKEFIDLHPEIDIELISSEDLLSLENREADVAFRGTNEPPPNLIGKRIGRVEYQIYGTREIYEKRLAGEPVRTIAWAGDGRSLPDWIASDYADTPSTLRVNRIEVMLQAAKNGMGAAQLACGLGDPDPLLARLPNSTPEPGLDFWILTHLDMRKTERVRRFREFMIDRLENSADTLEGRTTDIRGWDETSFG